MTDYYVGATGGGNGSTATNLMTLDAANNIAAVTYYKDADWIDQHADAFTNGTWEISESGNITAQFTDPNAVGPFHFYWTAWPQEGDKIGYGEAIVVLASAARPTDTVVGGTGTTAIRQTATRAPATRVPAVRTPRT